MAKISNPSEPDNSKNYLEILAETIKTWDEKSLRVQAKENVYEVKDLYEEIEIYQAFLKEEEDPEIKKEINHKLGKLLEKLQEKETKKKIYIHERNRRRKEKEDSEKALQKQEKKEREDQIELRQIIAAKRRLKEDIQELLVLLEEKGQRLQIVTQEDKDVKIALDRMKRHLLAANSAINMMPEV